MLERLSQEYALRNRIHIEEVSWDDPGAPVPMDAHLTPQEAIDKRRPKPSQCDIVVVVLWSRMGTPLPPEHTKPGGRPYVSGTEYEFCDAMDAAKRTGKPTTLVYRRTEEPKIGLGDRDLDEKHRQYEVLKPSLLNSPAPMALCARATRLTAPRASSRINSNARCVSLFKCSLRHSPMV